MSTSEQEADFEAEGSPPPVDTAESVQADAEQPEEEEGIDPSGVPMIKQITYPLANFQVVKVQPPQQGRVMIIHTPTETLVFPLQQGLADAIAKDLTSRVDVAPANALSALKVVGKR
jgi:hypothetical protein